MSFQDYAKRLAPLALGLVLCVSSVQMWLTESRRTITSESVLGILNNLHTISHQRGQTLHFAIACPDGTNVSDLHSEEPLMFVKAQDGQQVAATFTRETGYVSSFRITE